MLLLPRGIPGTPAPIVVSGAVSGLHDVLPLLLLPLLLLALLLLLCLVYVFAVNPGEHGRYASQPLLAICLRITAQIPTPLLRMLYEYSLAIDMCLVSRRRSRASVVFSCYAPARYVCCWCLLL